MPNSRTVELRDSEGDVQTSIEVEEASDDNGGDVALRIWNGDKNTGSYYVTADDLRRLVIALLEVM